MSEIKTVIMNLQEAGLMVQGLTMDQIEGLLRNDRRPVKEQLIALMVQGRGYGIYFYQDQACFNANEFARKLGEIGFNQDEASSAIANLRPKPAPELAGLGGRD
jgi:hypothetical protein